MGSHKWSMGMRTRAAVAEAAPASATTTPFLQVSQPLSCGVRIQGCEMVGFRSVGRSES